jgi:hypothetical protein
MCIRDSSTSCFNASFGGQDLYHMYSIIKTYLPQMTSLRIIVLGLDYDLLGYDLEVANEMWRDRQYYPYTHMLYKDGYGDQLVASSSFFRTNRDFMVLLQGKSSTKNADQLVVSPLDGASCMERAREHSVYKFKSGLIEKNLDYLQQLIFLCVDRGIRLILLETPKQDCYNANYCQETKNVAIAKIRELMQKNNMNFYDYSSDSTFDAGDFIDADHLNEAGAKKLIGRLQL